MSETEASEGEWLSSVLSPKSLILSSILNPEYSILWKHCTFVAVILKFVFFCHKKSTQLLSQMSRKSQQTRFEDNILDQICFGRQAASCVSLR